MIRRLFVFTLSAFALSAFGSGPATHSAQAAAAESPDSALAIYDGGGVYPMEFVVAWQGQSAIDRQTKDLLGKKREFVRRVVDRELMMREALRRPFTMSPAETLAYEKMKTVYLQNVLFAKLRAKEPKASDEDLALFARQNREIATIRFIYFKDAATARSWKQRIARGVPMSVLDGAIQQGGPDAPTAEAPRPVVAEQIPDSLAQRIWNMHPGELSDVIVSPKEVALIHVQGFIRRVSPVNLNDPGAVAQAYATRQDERVRIKLRAEFHDKFHVRYDDANMDYLLDRYVQTVPLRNTTDVNGAPNYRLTLPMPKVAIEDSTRLLATTSRGDTLTIGKYLRFWDEQPATARPEIRQIEMLAATTDRVLFLDELVRMAKEQGLERDSVVVDAMQRFHDAVALDHYYLNEVWNKVDMSPKKLEAYFAARPGHYDDAESVKPRMLMVDSKSLADSLRARLDAGDAFSDLAMNFSMDGESAAKGGQLELVTRGSNARGNVALEDAMFAAPLGKVQGPISVPEGFVLFIVDQKFPAKHRTLKDEDARGWATRDYQIEESERILNKLIDDLHAKAHVKYFPERMTKDLGANPDIAVE